MKSLIEHSRRLSQPTILMLCMGIVFLLGVVDWLSVREVSITLLVVLVVGFAAFAAGTSVGVWVGGAGMLVLTVAEWKQWGANRHPWILAWNTAVRLGLLLLTVRFIDVVRRLREDLEEKVRRRTAQLEKEVQAHEVVERRLRESTERFQTLSENIIEVFWITDAEKKQVLYVSPGYEKIWGRACESLYRDPRTWLEAVHAEDRARVEQSALTRQVRGEYDEEYRIVRPDGTLRWIRDRAFPVRDESGGITRIAGLAEDISVRKLAEEALRESEARFRQLGEATFEGIAVTDDGRLVDGNSQLAAMLGYELFEMIGRPVLDFIAPESQALVAEQMRTGYEAPYENLLLRRDGSVFPVQSQAKLMTWRGRQMRVTVLRDITERKRLEREVIETSANERRRLGQDLHDGLGQYLAGIALRVKALEQTLAEEAPAHAAEAKALGGLVGNAMRQARNLARGLDPVEVEEGEGRLMVALQRLAAESEDLFHVACEFTCTGAAVRLGAPVAVALYRITQEAIHNAVLHGEARKIQIELAMNHDQLRLRVQDDGLGFQPGAAAPTGMGLRVMHYRARSIGASLDVRSEPGHGAEICCRVPQAAWMRPVGDGSQRG